VSRRFSVHVDDYIASGCKDASAGDAIRTRLAQWAGLDAQIQQLAQRSSLVKDAGPASAALSQSSVLALAALERVHQGLPLTDDLKKQQLDALNAFETQAHKSQLTVPARGAFQKLIEAASNGGACIGVR
jgi:hypothetical protein